MASAISGRLEEIGDRLEAAGAKVERTSPLLPDLAQQFGDYMRFLMIAITRGMPQEGREPPTLTAWLGMVDQQARAIRAWSAFFADYDAVIAPAFGTVAYPHDDTPIGERMLMIDGQPSPNGLQLAWPALGNYPNLPGTSVPVGRDPEGLPIGVQVLTDRWRDHDAIALARWVHQLMTE